MTKSSPKTTILTAPQGWGKTMHAQQFLAEFGCTGLVDNWYPPMPVKLAALHLTHCLPKELQSYVESDVQVVSRGWA